MSNYKIGDFVVCKFGKGKIVNIEHYNRLPGAPNRYCIYLDTTPFSYNPVCVWSDEISQKIEVQL